MIATTAGLVKVAMQVRKYCKKHAEKLEALEQARVSGIDQLTALRTVFKSFASSFDKYNTDVINLLDPKSKEDIGDIMKDTIEIMETSEGTVSKLRALAKTKAGSKSEVDELGRKLAHAIQVIECLLGSFSRLVDRLLHEINTLTDAYQSQTHRTRNASTCQLKQRRT